MSVVVGTHIYCILCYILMAFETYLLTDCCCSRNEAKIELEEQLPFFSTLTSHYTTTRTLPSTISLVNGIQSYDNVKNKRLCMF